ncbi:hypothetical protein E2562_031498 [Oryza meyeriana var. granulata]|uniref:Uncharacterized protein n=1 Tax=Oryza meyeriana var. granulata TaxID=110450 RepID=A0A6G1ERS7_9ORYZ|nr:hypothetical protein E2562_031498 [Oryza meyeriana var. granulata]
MEKAKVPKAHWDAFASKINKEYGKFRYSPIDNLNELEVMFQNIHVSGASSVIPGASKDNAKDKAAQHYRAVFRSFESNEGRMSWLRRMYEDRKKN